MTDADLPLTPPAGARHSAAAERNREPILAELLGRLPPQGVAIEIAAGTGQHAAHFAPRLPGWRWHPTDADADALASIDAWCQGMANVAPALALDITRRPWAGVPVSADLVYAANLVHIAPWAVAVALLHGAAHVLAPGGRLITYGPYLLDDEKTAPSNLAFDRSLRERNAAWGIRRLADLQTEAAGAGLSLAASVAMPANNRLLVWGRAG